MSTIALGSTLLTYPEHSWDHGIHLITGPSGSGKTTLLKAMHGLLNKGGAADFRLDHTAFMPQQPLWVPYLSMQEHLKGATAPPDALEQLGLAGLLQRLPHQLSVGQSQRFWVLWALAQQKRITLMDEPTSALDDDWADAVIELIKQESLRDAGRTFVLVTHDLRLKNAFSHAKKMTL